MTAKSISKALGGRKANNGWTARCPAHDDKTPSLSIRDADGGRVLVHCHAGCDQELVISTLRSRGLWTGNGQRFSSRFAPHGGRKKAEPNPNDDKRSKAALSIWQAAKPAVGTPVETYLGSRGLYLPPTMMLRFHAGLKHPSGGVWPAMVALVTRGSNGIPLAIHRTFLARDGSGKAPIDPQKMMLGPCRGGAIRLAESDDALMVGEGIETCLTAMQATGRPGWAALSTSGLRALDLPDTVHQVVVLADGDDAGEGAAMDAALRWKREGRSVRIARPPRGCDFNDLLLGRAHRKEEDVA
jgi:putative DNA primase/helicase